MKSTIILPVLAIAIPALAQSLADLPTCATTCAINAIGTSGCALTNTSCICESPTFFSNFSSCVDGACTAAQITNATDFGVSYCAAAGVSVTTGVLSATGSSSAAATANSTSSETSSSTSAAAAAGTSSSASSTSASSSSASSSKTSSSATAASTSTSTGSAALLQVPLVAGIFGLFAFAL